MDWVALRVSLWLAAGTVALLVPCGVFFGRFLAFHRFRGKLLIEALLTVPLVLPPTVLGYYLLVTFAPALPWGARLKRWSATRCPFRSKDCCSRR